MLALTLLPAKKPVAFLCTTQLVMWTLSCVEPEDGLTLIPFPALLMIVVLLISRRPPPMRLSAIPWPGLPFCPSIRQLTMKTAEADTMFTPLVPVPAPWIDRPRRVTDLRTSAGSVMFMMTPLNPPLEDPLRMPAITGVPSMVIDLIMVTAPNPPESRQLISPSFAVFEMAPAKVLQGAVRLQGLRSSPTPDTQVRGA